MRLAKVSATTTSTEISLQCSYNCYLLLTNKHLTLNLNHGDGDLFAWSTLSALELLHLEPQFKVEQLQTKQSWSQIDLMN